MKQSHRIFGISAVIGAMLLGMVTTSITSVEAARTFTDPDTGVVWNIDYDINGNEYWYADGAENISHIWDHVPATPTNQSPDAGKMTVNDHEGMNPINVPTEKHQTITTPDVAFVRLYALNDSYTSTSLLGSRALGGKTAWYSDKKVTISGTTYYRVATNEWAKQNEMNHPQD